jgi:hypothetical protein
MTVGPRGRVVAWAGMAVASVDAVAARPMAVNHATARQEPTLKRDVDNMEMVPLP